MQESFGSIVAEIAEVSIGADNQPVVHKVTCAIDCGWAVNPDTVEVQLESGIIFGLTAAMYGEITIENGRVAQNNFPDYEMVRMATAFSQVAKARSRMGIQKTLRLMRCSHT